MEVFIVLVVLSPFVMIVSFGIFINRLQQKKNARVIIGRISDNVYRPHSKWAAARIRLSEGTNKGKTFVSMSTLSVFGHSIGKVVKVLEFKVNNDFVYKALKGYIGIPILIGLFSTFVLVLGIIVL